MSASHLGSSLVDQFARWIRENTTVQALGKGVHEITAPLLDRHNDYMQIYVEEQEDGSLRLSDDGLTLSDLAMSGVDFSTPKRKEHLTLILHRFGVSLDPTSDSLYTTCSKEHFSQKKLDLLQAMMAVGDLHVLAQPNIVDIFQQDVEHFLQKNGILFVPNIRFTGRSGFTYPFDYVIAASSKQPERAIRVITALDRGTASMLRVAWEDAVCLRPIDTRVYAFYQTKRSKDENALQLLRDAKIVPVAWEHRDKYVNELAS